MTFGAFKSHEEIENEYIVGQLHARLAINLGRVLSNDMHGDDRLEKLIILFRNVQSIVGRHSCKKSVRLQQAGRLRKELDAFMVDFIPHMEEEEAVRDSVDRAPNVLFSEPEPMQNTDVAIDRDNGVQAP